MKFADFVSPKAICVNLTADDKEGVIRELAQALQDAGEVAETDLDGIIKAILKREDLGSTGIGHGVAVPHSKHANVRRMVAAVGLSQEGVDFKSLDGEIVQVFFMLISPMDRLSEHLGALQKISRQLQDETFRKFLRSSKTAEEVMQLLLEADTKG